METIRLMHAKLHRVRITECRPDYMGSLGIDKVWMKQVGILPLEEIQCWNVTRGTRFATYAIPAAAASREISPNGACAHLCEEGDLLIICSFKQRSVSEVSSRGHRARVLLFGDDGLPKQLLIQDVTPRNGEFEFTSEEAIVN